jgi:DNA repair protein RadC
MLIPKKAIEGLENHLLYEAREVLGFLLEFNAKEIIKEVNIMSQSIDNVIIQPPTILSAF